MGNANAMPSRLPQPNQAKNTKQSGLKPKRKHERTIPPANFAKRKRRVIRTDNAKLSGLPKVTPLNNCAIKLWRVNRIKDYLLLEDEFVCRQERFPGLLIKMKARESRLLSNLRDTPMELGTIEEMIDEQHAIVTPNTEPGTQYYSRVMSFVDKGLLQPGGTVLLHHKSFKVIGSLASEMSPLITVMRMEKCPKETYADIGGLETQINEIKESVELPLTRPELYEEIGIRPPKGVILYGPPGTGKTLLAKAVASRTDATFLHLVGSELIQKHLGDGPKLVRELFRTADQHAPSIIFIDEIDAIGTKRYDSNSGGEREVQRTMLELLNQLDGFDDRGDVKIILATNRIDTLDPALIRPGRIDRKIEFPLPDERTRRRIFDVLASKMSMSNEVKFDALLEIKESFTGADLKAICTEAGLLALRSRRSKVTLSDFREAKNCVIFKKKGGIVEAMYL